MVMLEMTGILQIVAENSEMILIVISLVFALVARYFQTKASAIAEALQAVTDLSQSVLDAVKDGVISQDELTSILAKIEAAKKEIQDVIDILTPQPTIAEKLAAIVFGYKRERLATIKLNVQSIKMKNLITKANR